MAGKTLVPEEVMAELGLKGQVGVNQTIGRVKSIWGRGDSMGKGPVETKGCLQRTSNSLSLGNQKQDRWPEMWPRR